MYRRIWWKSTPMWSDPNRNRLLKTGHSGGLFWKIATFFLFKINGFHMNVCSSTNFFSISFRMDYLMCCRHSNEICFCDRFFFGGKMKLFFVVDKMFLYVAKKTLKNDIFDWIRFDMFIFIFGIIKEEKHGPNSKRLIGISSIILPPETYFIITLSPIIGKHTHN